MIEFTPRIDFNDAALKSSLLQNVKRAQKALDLQVLKDSNYFCPLDTSMLQKSGILNTVAGSGKVCWDTPYAKAQYYGVNFDHSKQQNPNACSHWFEAAKVKHLKDWTALVKSIIAGGL